MEKMDVCVQTITLEHSAPTLAVRAVPEKKCILFYELTLFYVLALQYNS